MAAEPTQIITAAESRAVDQERKSVLVRIADRYGIDAKVMMGTLRATVFKGDVTNEQLAMLLVVADQHKLNPFTKEIYAFPSQQGIVPVVGVDGWARIVNEHPQFDGMDFEQDDEKCTCKMYRKDRGHPTEITEYLSECKRGTGPWQSHPKRMLRHKAMIQCARIAFSFAGIYDPDEAEAIVQAEIDVTPGNEVLPTEGKVAPKKLRAVVEGMREAVTKQDAPGLFKIYNELTNEQRLFVWGTLQSWERSAIKALQKQPGYHVDLTSWSAEAIRTAKEPASLQASWTAIQDAFAEVDSEVPADLETLHQDRKAELGA